MTERYKSQIILDGIGIEGQREIGRKAVLVIGAGGLGSAICPYLVGAGIGKLGIIDADTVSLGNLHRQILYRENEIGQAKASKAKESLQQLNSEVEIVDYPIFFEETNALSILKKYDIIVDACDNFSTRYLINDACLQTDKPFVYGAIAGFRGQLAVFNYREGASYRCLFPDQEAMCKANTASSGVLGMLPAIVGALQANEVLKLICHHGELLNDRLYTIDLLYNKTYTFAITRTEKGRLDSFLRKL